MKTIDRNNFFVITGGPGMGKTTLLEEMERRKYLCIPETGRQIIIDQLHTNGTALPWKSPLRFAELMFKQAKADFMDYPERNQPVLFDRGIPDISGYLKLNNIQPPNEITNAAKYLRYHPIVFITPPWEEIYKNDSERKQSFAEAVRTYEMMADTYKKRGYQLLEIPKVTTLERADFMIEKIGI
ncbi:AAA family ATPase [Pedobacter caeni]|uniref:Predicted ATPase n=1 Tax=Pedobacter caeni TaxID=288992 RepID=A0A1M5PU19_9SPHI|nr:AAA family ATPase [Pedobacter caeni]SHH05202.1 Predicted ATPase [Pedobacter caeni]